MRPDRGQLTGTTEAPESSGSGASFVLRVGDIALALDATVDSVGYGLRLLRTPGLVDLSRTGDDPDGGDQS